MKFKPGDKVVYKIKGSLLYGNMYTLTDLYSNTSMNIRWNVKEDDTIALNEAHIRKATKLEVVLK